MFWDGCGVCLWVRMDTVGSYWGLGVKKKDTCDHGCLLWVGTVHGRTRKVTEKVDMRQRGRSVIIDTLHNHRPHS